MVSIIIVNYKVQKELFGCLQSIFASKSKSFYEIIVVDNDEIKTLQKKLHARFPKVIYLPCENKGFGYANNYGAKKAKGEYLFFLNPDTKVFPKTLDQLITFLKKNKKAGIVAPLLLGKDNKPYQQGSLELTPLRGIFSLSFINKIFPSNPISKGYFFLDWDRASVKEVSVVPGTAFMIRKELFEKSKGFDKQFFLFFEEFDLCKRIKALGWKLFIIPTARVSHAWGSSTKQRKDIKKIFAKSRFSYFKKHFGILSALIVEAIVRVDKYKVLLSVVLLIALVLRVMKLDETMAFIGDQGWFYLAARDMLLTREIPLVGIETSRPWLHQGPLWTYLLGSAFFFGGFHPLTGAGLSIAFGLASILGMYKLGEVMMSKRVGLLSAMLFATSPLVVIFDRMPYHTSPIPFFTILFMYFLFRWLQGQRKFFPLIVFTLAILYNFELATFLLTFVTGIIWVYGFLSKKKWALLSPKLILLSILAFFIPMMPMLLYDIAHGFPQTLGFAAWLAYKLLGTVGIIQTIATSHSLLSVILFLREKMILLIYGFNGAFAFIILLASLVYLHMQAKKKEVTSIILIFLNYVLLIGFLVAKTPSDAYLPMMFPSFLLTLAIFFNWTFANKYTKYFFVPTFLLIVLFNIFYNFYWVFTKQNSLEQRVLVAKQIVTQSEKKEYNLIGKGHASEFESFTMNYEYLTWWLGHGPSKEKKELQFVIEESKGKIILEKEKNAL